MYVMCLFKSYTVNREAKYFICRGEDVNIDCSPFCLPYGKADYTPHLLRYQGLAVGDYGFALDASNMGHPRLSLN